MIINLNLSIHYSKLNKHNEMKSCTNLFMIVQELDVACLASLRIKHKPLRLQLVFRISLASFLVFGPKKIFDGLSPPALAVVDEFVELCAFVEYLW